MWNFPGPGIKPVSPAEDFFTTELPGKAQMWLFKQADDQHRHVVHLYISVLVFCFCFCFCFFSLERKLNSRTDSTQDLGKPASSSPLAYTNIPFQNLFKPVNSHVCPLDMKWLCPSSHPFLMPGITCLLSPLVVSLVAQMVENPPAMQETRVQSLGREDPLEKGMAIHSSILAWSIPWTEEAGGLYSMRSKESDRTEQLKLSLSLFLLKSNTSLKSRFTSYLFC